MKTITEVERQELQLKIEAVTGRSFEHPLPEFFVGETRGMIATAETAVDSQISLGGKNYSLPPMMKLIVLFGNELYALKRVRAFGIN